ncbi:ABC transporter ATP-binding protein [Paenibacillus sp. FSL R7-0337]|uniref:ABC transporter ATP-binding protein n=1 Tax=Paenibacillus sp. FSL R7-0337 TaxID=1926588 RepID=UPI0009F8BE88|nr:ABC transporter ATP-binding protein [Paenibacillus sp. FSL R7-0337]
MQIYGASKALGIGTVMIMKDKYTPLVIVLRVYKQTLKAAPWSGILSPLYYLLEGIFPVFITIVSARLFNEIFAYTQGRTEAESLFVYGGVLLAGYVLKQILQFISNITINAGVYERCTDYHKQAIAHKSSRLPLIQYEDSETMNIKTRAMDCVNREVLSQIYMSSAVFVTSAISIISLVSVLASYNLLFILLSLLTVMPYFIARRLRGKDFYALKKRQTKRVRYRDYLWEMFNDKTAVKEMRTMGFDQYLREQFKETRVEINKELWEFSKKDALSLLFCDTIRVIGYTASVVLALVLTISGEINIGLFGASIGAFLSVQNETKKFLMDLGSLPEKIAFAKDYYAFLDLPEECNGSVQKDSLTESIRLEQLEFTYPNAGDKTIKGVDLEIHKGEKIVIIGENGSGKTTLSKLILGLYPVQRGTVTYDGEALAELNQEALFQMISIIPQDFMRYSLTLRENICISDLGRSDADRDILDVLEMVELDIDPAGLDRTLGREFDGVELSGGQWQKLSIARGLFKDSELIVMDEPTSALDPLIEHQILMNFLTVAQCKTAIIVSHRTGLCRHVDRIVVMKAGEIVEVGSHSELIQRDGEYTRLYTTQEQWYV